MTKPSLRARLPALAGALVLIAVLAGALAESASATGVRYFVVAENPSTFDPCFHCDSYILPLSDPEDIAEAREIIARGGTGLGTIVVAKIVAGSDGINRDVLAPGEPLWSWHVTEFGLFADGVIEILEGWPGGVEMDVEGWIRNTGGGGDIGVVGFPEYTVVEELPVPEPAPRPALLAAGAALLAVRWWRGRCAARSTVRGGARVGWRDLPGGTGSTRPRPRRVVPGVPPHGGL